MPGSRDQALQEDGPVAERAQRLVARALEGVRQVLGGGHHPDAATATPRGRLEHQWVADLIGAGQRAVERVDRPPAPRSDRDAHLLGEQLRADLVAQPAHRLGTWTDEGDTQAIAQVDERGVLGHEAPPRPHRVGTAFGQGTFDDRQIDVGPCRCRPEVIRQVGLAHEHGAGLVRRVQGDRLDDGVTGVTGRVDVPHGVDQAHRRLAAVRDRNARDHRQKPPKQGVAGPGCAWLLSRTRSVGASIASLLRLEHRHRDRATGPPLVRRDLGARSRRTSYEVVAIATRTYDVVGGRAPVIGLVDVVLAQS